MRLFVIALHINPNTSDIVGYRLIDADTGDVRDANINTVYGVLKGKTAPIYPLKLGRGKNISSTFSYDTMTKLADGKIVNKAKYTLLNVYTDGERVTSLDLVNHLGSKFNSSYGEALPAIAFNEVYNTRLKSDKSIELPIGVKVITLDTKKEQIKKDIKKKEELEYAKEIKKERIKELRDSNINLNNTLYPRLVYKQKMIPEKMHEIDESTGMTIEQKIAAVKMQLRALQPFYNSILSILSLEVGNVERMGVSLDTLYFNPDFIKATSIPQLLFIIIHEVLHIAMKHNSREMGRDHYCWNSACDYYINKVISEEFKLGEDNVRYDAMKAIQHSHINNRKIYMERPDWVLYTPNIDVDKDTPEKIYLELLEIKNKSEAPNNGDSNQNQNSNEQQNSNGSNNQGQQGQNQGQGQQGQCQGQGKQGQDQGQQGQGQQGQGQQGQGQQSQGQQSQGQQSQGQQGQGQQGQEGQGFATSDNKPDETGLNGKTFRGKVIKNANTLDDIVVDERSKSLSEDAANQLANRMLTRAVMHFKQSNNKSLSSDNLVERMVALELAPKIDWRALLKNKLTAASQKINTFSAPDKRFRSRNMIMPGPKNLEPDKLDNVKVCIDTSGSIGDKELAEAMGQIKQLLDTFKASASIIYWDTEVRCEVPFKDIKELLKIKPRGGGGTDANCIFNYFETNADYKRRRKKQPSIIIVFTDGYFDTIDGRYKKYKDTIWVIHSNDDFKKPFGHMAKFKN